MSGVLAACAHTAPDCHQLDPPVGGWAEPV